MDHSAIHPRPAPLARRLLLVALALLGGAVVTTAAGRSPVASAPTSSVAPGAMPSAGSGPPAGEPIGPGPADGSIPDGDSVSAFDAEVPAVARLVPALRHALRAAAADARADGVELRVNSGWRSPAYQRRLLEEAVAHHGSRRAAARWVATPETSVHVSGGAVDVGPARAAAWLAHHGAVHGLCRVYDNEPWHFELLPSAVAVGCPTTYQDPTHDPRMQP